MLLRLFLVAALVALGGCTIVDIRDSVTYEHDNKRVPEEVISKIVPGRTTRKWVEEYVGKPDRVTKHQNGSEIFTYRFSENKKNRVRIFVFFKYENTGHREKHVYIHFVDGKVYKLWRDYTLPVIAEDMYDVLVVKTAEDDVDLIPSGTRSKKKLFRSQVTDVQPQDKSSEAAVEGEEKSSQESGKKAPPKQWWWPF